MSLMLASLVKSSLVVLMALLAVMLLRRRSASVRHCVLAAAIVCAVAVPALTFVVPAWQMPTRTSAGSAWVAAPLVLLSEPPDVDAGGGVQPGATGLRVATAVRRLVAPTWTAGTFVSLLVLLIGFGRLRWIASRAARVERGPWATIVIQECRRSGLHRPIRLLQSDRPALLVTWGFFRPTVILPAAARTWSEDRVGAVLCHELAHIRRQDWAVQLAADCLRSIYWFNPLVWVACRRLRQESEQACDDEVLRAGVDGATYATELLDLARELTKRRRDWVPAPAIAHRSSLERRVRAMLNNHLSRTPVTRAARAAIAVALAAVTLPVAGFGSPRVPEPAVDGRSVEFAAVEQSTADLERFAAATRQLAPQSNQQADPGSPRAVPGTLSGTVRDQLGGLMSGVSMVLTLVDGPSRVATTRATDESGSFEFVGLPPWTYELRATLPGFRTRNDSVTVPEGGRVQWDLEMELGSLQETITVTDAPPLPELVLDDAQVERRRQFLRSQRDTDPCLTSGTGGCVRQPTKIKHVTPVYPPDLLSARVTGTVIMEGRIGTNGFIANPTVRPKPHPGLARAAVDAVTAWEFEPTRLNGVPVETDMTISVTFTLGETGDRQLTKQQLTKQQLTKQQLRRAEAEKAAAAASKGP
jgi:TonB family protein